MESKQEKQRGGKRKGSGRKPGPNVWVRFPVPREVWAVITAEASEKGSTPELHAAEVLTDHATAPLFSR